MNPWIVLGVLVALASDRTRETVELATLRRTVGDLKDELAAATARSAFAAPPQSEPHRSWGEPTQPGELEPLRTEPAEQLPETLRPSFILAIMCRAS